MYEPKSLVFDSIDVPNWALGRFSTLSNSISSLVNLFNTALPEFMGLPGSTADINGLYYISKTYAKIYKQIVLWSIETYSMRVPEDCENLKFMVVNLSRLPIEQIRQYPFDIAHQIDAYKSNTLDHSEKK